MQRNAMQLFNTHTHPPTHTHSHTLTHTKNKNNQECWHWCHQDQRNANIRQRNAMQLFNTHTHPHTHTHTHSHTLKIKTIKSVGIGATKTNAMLI